LSVRQHFRGSEHREFELGWGSEAWPHNFQTARGAIARRQRQRRGRVLTPKPACAPSRRDCKINLAERKRLESEQIRARKLEPGLGEFSAFPIRAMESFGRYQPANPAGTQMDPSVEDVGKKRD